MSYSIAIGWFESEIESGIQILTTRPQLLGPTEFGLGSDNYLKNDKY